MVSNGSQAGNSSALRAAAPRSRSWAVCILIVAVIAVGGGAAAYWLWPPVGRGDSTAGRSGASDRAALDSVERATAAEADTELEAATFHNPGYLGPQACAPCHAKRV